MPAVTVTSTDIVASAHSATVAAPDALLPARTRLRILTYLHSFAPGGVERIAARLHAAWTTSGVEPEILLADDSFAPPMPLSGVRQIEAKPIRRGPMRFAAFLSALRTHVVTDRPQVLFCAGNTYSALAVMLRLLIGPTCPPIVAKISNDLVRHDMPWLVRIFYRRWLRIQGRWIDHFVGMAPAMRGEIARFTGVSQGRIGIIGDPALAEADLARLAALRDATPRVRKGRHYLAVGRLAPQKDFALLLDAFSQMAQPDDTLHILGEGPERRTLEAQAARLGIAAAVHMPGHVDPLDPWLAKADAFVLSSRFEGVPAVIVEALAAGLPIVATDCCVSMADLLGHGALGQLVPTGDADALAAAMDAIGDEPRATVLARRAAAAAFTIEHAAEAYLEVMRALVEARAATAAALNRPRSDPVPTRAAWPNRSRRHP